MTGVFVVFRSSAADKGSKAKVKKAGSKPSKEKAVLGNQPHISEKGQGEKWVPWLFVCRPPRPVVVGLGFCLMRCSLYGLQAFSMQNPSWTIFFSSVCFVSQVLFHSVNSFCSVMVQTKIYRLSYFVFLSLHMFCESVLCFCCCF